MPPSLSPSPTLLTPLLPPKTLVGIDLVTFTSTPQFHGIRDLPNGWHFLYTGTTESLSLRCGGWFYVGDTSALENDISDGAVASRSSEHPGPEVFVWKWDSDSEILAPLKGGNVVEKQEAMRYKANLGAIWQSGGLFRYRSRVSSTPGGGRRVAAQDEYDEEDEEEGRRDWAGLTNHLFPRLLSRIVGQPDIDVGGRPRWMVTSASTAGRDTEHIPGLSSPGREYAEGATESEFSFLPIDLKRTWREGAIGRERTEAAQDRSWALGDLINRYGDTGRDRSGEAQILGELQFTFLMVLTLMNYSCLQQWKRLLGLLLTCRTAIKDRELFFRDVLKLLLLQLQRCDDLEGGFFEVDSDEGGEFLRKLLIKFSMYVGEIVGGEESAVKTELARLEDWVKSEFGWELQPEPIVRRGMLQLEDGEQVEMEISGNEDEETGEYAPLVVDLDEGGTADDDVDMGVHMR
ncbi:AAR2 family [Aspergillus sclerotialis]|uniref:AAR2 family n=1 Tax=Aspergillus sclerotialis TaxID=2070753 RepID=A0A3A3A8B3_9EURO|nr:AAR2 family [Aspergillus sclerotialis]